MVYYTCQTMMAYSQCIPADGHNTLLRAFIAAVAVCQRVSTILNSVLGMHMQVFIFFHALEIKTQSTANAMHSAAGGSRACVVDSQLDKTDACLPPTGRRGCSRCSQVLFQCVYGKQFAQQGREKIKHRHHCCPKTYPDWMSGLAAPRVLTTGAPSSAIGEPVSPGPSDSGGTSDIV